MQMKNLEFTKSESWFPLRANLANFELASDTPSEEQPGDDHFKLRDESNEDAFASQTGRD